MGSDSSRFGGTLAIPEANALYDVFIEYTTVPSSQPRRIILMWQVSFCDPLLFLHYRNCFTAICVAVFWIGGPRSCPLDSTLHQERCRQSPHKSYYAAKLVRPPCLRFPLLSIHENIN